MKFNVQSKLLFSRLSAVSKVVASKNAYAILDNFLFELENDRLVITGSDMETRLTTTVGVTDVEGAGKFAIDVKRMLNALKELPDTALTFEVKDDLSVNITYVNGHYDAAAFNGDDYPQKTAPVTEAQKFQLQGKDVVNGIQHTLFAVGTDDMHPQFMGIYWDIMPDMIVFVSSDSHKLVRYRKMNVKPGLQRSFILPSKPASILMSIIDRNSEEPVVISVDESSATFETADYSLSCRLVNGRYPNYNSVIPENNPFSVYVDRQTMLNALRRVAIFASVGGLIKIDLAADKMVLTSQDLDHATAAEEVVECEYDGEPMTVGFKSSDVIDVVNNLDSEAIYLKLLDPARAGIFLPAEQEEGEELLILQMPMMI